jgi:hypothetical protein
VFPKNTTRINTVKPQTENALNERGEEESDGGGNYYRTIRSRLGDSFLRKRNKVFINLVATTAS